MKIIISANVIFTIANFRKDLIKSLVDNGYEVICIADDDNLSSNSKEILDELNVTYEKINVSRKGLNPLADMSYFFNLLKLYKKYSPDIVLHFTIKPNIYGTIATKLIGAKSINTINGLGSAIIADNFLSKVLKLMYKSSLYFSDKIFFQNEDDKLFFETEKIIKSKNSSIVPGSGVDVKSFMKDKRRTKKTFLLVARLLKDKGIYEYIEVIKIIKQKYNNVEFLLAGPYDDGNPTAITKAEVIEWENEGYIKYLGQTDNIKDFFKLCDIVVLPSYREGLSRVLIESASAYKVLVTNDIAGCKDVVIDGYNGFLSKVKDVESLVEAIEKVIILDDDKLEEFMDNSRKIAENNFDKTIVNSIYLLAIEKLMKGVK